MARRAHETETATAGALLNEDAVITEQVAARYLGDGSAWIGGVPARDLTHEEWAALGDDLQAQCLGTGLYEAFGALSVSEEATDGGKRE